MGVSYNRLWKMLINKNMKRIEMQYLTGISGDVYKRQLQRRQNFLRLGLGHLTQHHELIPTDAEDFPPIPHRLGDTLGSAAYQLVPRLMPQGIVDPL